MPFNTQYRQQLEYRRAELLLENCHRVGCRSVATCLTCFAFVKRTKHTHTLSFTFRYTDSSHWKIHNKWTRNNKEAKEKNSNQFSLFSVVIVIVFGVTPLSCAHCRHHRTCFSLLSFRCCCCHRLLHYVWLLGLSLLCLSLGVLFTFWFYKLNFCIRDKLCIFITERVLMTMNAQPLEEQDTRFKTEQTRRRRGKKHTENSSTTRFQFSWLMHTLTHTWN